MYQLSEFTKQIKLAEFPGWKCYVVRFKMQVKKETVGNKNQCIEDDSCYPRYSEKVYNLIPDDVDYYDKNLWSNFTKGQLEDGDKIILHSKCDIPSTVIKKYETVTSISRVVPTKYIVPLRGNDGGRSIFTSTLHNSVVFVNDDAKVVLLINNGWYSNGKDRSYDADLYMLTLKQTFYNAEGFRLMDDCVKYYQAVNFADPIDYLIFNGVVPPELIINEADIPIGDDRVTKETILNSYRLLQSRDTQIQDTALLTLAQCDCSGYEELLGWLFDEIANNTYTLKAKNSAFRWLMIRINKFGRYRSVNDIFHQLNSIIAGRWLVKQITGEKVYWDSNGRLCIEDQSVINRPIKRLIEHIP